MVRKAKAKKPKVAKKPRAKKSVNSNVNKISININTRGGAVGGRRKRNKNAVSGESTGGLSGPDNNAGGVTGYQAPTVSRISVEDKKEPQLKGLLEGIQKTITGNNLLLEDRQQKSNLLIEDRLGQIGQSTANNKLLLDNGYTQFNNYIGNQKQLLINNNSNVEEITPVKATPLKTPIKAPINISTKEIKKGSNKFRVSLDAQGKLKTEKFQIGTKVYTKSSLSALQKSTGTSKAELDQIKREFKGNTVKTVKAPAEPSSDITPMVSNNLPILSPKKTPSTPKKEPDVLPPKEMKATASKITNPLVDQDDSDDGTEDIDYRKVHPSPRFTSNIFQKTKTNLPPKSSLVDDYDDYDGTEFINDDAGDY
jgi:hypothetical protein